MNAIAPEQAAALRKLAIAELWRRRAFWPLLEAYLDRAQLEDARRFFEGGDVVHGRMPSADWADDISRQYGKSYKWTVISVAWCHCFPGQQVKYLAQFGTSVRGIIAPVIDALLEDMPPQFRPRHEGPEAVHVDKQDHKWHFPHPKGQSTLHATGANNKHYKSLRGPKAHLIVQDECGFYDDYEDVQSALRPMLITTKGACAYATTPAETPLHPHKARLENLKREGRSVHHTIHQHPRLSQQDVKDLLAREAKLLGMEYEQFVRTTFYRREYLCLWVAEETRAIVPEWSAVADDTNPEGGTLGDLLEYDSDTLPEFFAYADALDIGFTRDPSGYIQAHWDFKQACLMVHAELPPLHRKRTDELATAIKGCREAYVPTSRPPPHVDAVRHSSGGHWLPYLSVGDAGGNGAEKLAELAKHHDIHFIHAEKTDLESMVDELRVLIRQGKVKVHRRCKHLLAQLANGLWADKGKTDFERTPHHHNDHLIALVYLVRMLAGLRAFNPYPPFHGQDPANMIIPERRDSTGIQAVKSVFE
jgi:hypothetical protein